MLQSVQLQTQLDTIEKLNNKIVEKTKLKNYRIYMDYKES